MSLITKEMALPDGLNLTVHLKYLHEANQISYSEVGCCWPVKYMNTIDLVVIGIKSELIQHP